jgi:hypothetical protein
MSRPKSTPVLVDPEFEALIPPLSAEECSQLESNLRDHGLQSPLVVWQPPDQKDRFILLDGHHRLKILKKLDTNPSERYFDHFDFQDPTEPIFRDVENDGRPRQIMSREDAKLWILRNQAGRRNLSASQRAALAVEMEKLLAVEAKKRQGTRTDIQEKLPEGSEGQARDKAADIYSVSPRYVQDAKKIAKQSPETFAEVKAGTVTLSEAKRGLYDGLSKPSDCKICGQHFDSKSQLKKHGRTEHNISVEQLSAFLNPEQQKKISDAVESAGPETKLPVSESKISSATFPRTNPVRNVYNAADLIFDCGYKILTVNKDIQSDENLMSVLEEARQFFKYTMLAARGEIEKWKNRGNGNKYTEEEMAAQSEEEKKVRSLENHFGKVGLPMYITRDTAKLQEKWHVHFRPLKEEQVKKLADLIERGQA